jgi:hypothetical protein
VRYSRDLLDVRSRTAFQVLYCNVQWSVLNMIWSGRFNILSSLLSRHLDPGFFLPATLAPSIKHPMCLHLIIYVTPSVHSSFFPHSILPSIRTPSSILVPSGTTLDYTLDQLFVHLDDPSPAMQTAVLKVILVASRIDPGLVVKKAGQCRLSQRSPEFCDKILYEIQGFEILPDEK